MRVSVIISLLLLTLTFSSNAQNIKYNLQNLDNLSVEISDKDDLVSSKIQQKLITEIKLKLMSAGIKVTSPDESSARMVVNTNAITSYLGQHRLLVQLNIYEIANIQRVHAIKTQAITYSDYSFFTAQYIEQSIYDKIMDVIIINFIENYLSQK